MQFLFFVLGKVGVDEGEGVHDDPPRVRPPHLYPERPLQDDILLGVNFFEHLFLQCFGQL